MPVDIHDPQSVDSNATVRLEDLDNTVDLEQFLQPCKTFIADHGRLTPITPRAKEAFHEVASALCQRPKWNTNARSFMSITVDPSTSRFLGHWRFNLDILPKIFDVGVVFGGSHEDADCLLTMDPTRDRVAGRHARMFHDPKSRVVRTHAFPEKTLYINDKEIDDKGTTLADNKAMWVIGDLCYRFEFLDHDAARYNEFLNDLMLASAAHPRFDHRFFDPTPQRDHTIFRGYQMHTVQASGSEGAIFPCVRVDTSQIYAVKRRTRNRHTLAKIKEEWKIYRTLGDHHRICYLLEALFSGGDEASMGTRSADDVFFILCPYAPKTLTAWIDDQQKEPVIQRVAYQMVEGLYYIHSHNIIHRDIKPANVLITRPRSWEVRITDFGHATTEVRSQDHMKGTEDYHPPEIRKLKRSAAFGQFSGIAAIGDSPDGDYWSPGSDMFSLGVTLHELLFKRRPGHMDEQKHTQLIVRAKARGTGLSKLICDLLVRDPGERPSSGAVLARQLWSVPDVIPAKRTRD